MAPGTPPQPPQRSWSVTTSAAPGRPALRCAACGPLTPPPGTAPRRAALDHLGRHALHALLPPYLRTCQCGEERCRQHPRHRGCDGGLLLLLTRDPRGRTWRLADTCAACAAVTPHSAVVAEGRWDLLPGHDRLPFPADRTGSGNSPTACGSPMSSTCCSEQGRRPGPSLRSQPFAGHRPRRPFPGRRRHGPSGQADGSGTGENASPARPGPVLPLRRVQSLRRRVPQWRLHRRRQPPEETAPLRRQLPAHSARVRGEAAPRRSRQSSGRLRPGRPRTEPPAGPQKLRLPTTARKGRSGPASATRHRHSPGPAHRHQRPSSPVTPRATSAQPVDSIHR